MTLHHCNSQDQQLQHHAGESESDDEGMPPSYKPDKSRKSSSFKSAASNFEDEAMSQGCTSTALPLTDASAAGPDQVTPDSAGNVADRADSSSKAAQPAEQDMAHNTQSNAVEPGSVPVHGNASRSFTHPSALLQPASPESTSDTAGMSWHQHQALSINNSSTANLSADGSSEAVNREAEWHSRGEADSNAQSNSGDEAAAGGGASGGAGCNLGQGWGQKGVQGQGLGGNLAFQQELQQRASHREAARAGTLSSDASGAGEEPGTAQAPR